MRVRAFARVCCVNAGGKCMSGIKPWWYQSGDACGDAGGDAVGDAGGDACGDAGSDGQQQYLCFELDPVPSALRVMT